MKIPEHYIEKVYAGWLGKLIGIRMGSAIEGWGYHKIRRVLGELDGYPHSYKNFAADKMARVLEAEAAATQEPTYPA